MKLKEELRKKLLMIKSIKDNLIRRKWSYNLALTRTPVTFAMDLLDRLENIFRNKNNIHKFWNRYFIRSNKESFEIIKQRAIDFYE